jgi:hypothetical protein
MKQRKILLISADGMMMNIIFLPEGPWPVV